MKHYCVLFTIFIIARYITVFKKEKSTIVARDASLELCDESRQIVTRLLTR